MKIKEIIENNDIEEVMITTRFCDGEEETVIIPITSKKILRKYLYIETDIYYISLDKTLCITQNLQEPYLTFPIFSKSGSYRGVGV